MKFPSEQYKIVSEERDKWMGPCSDSFCYHGCDMAHCKWDRRLGDTPKEHNMALKR